MPLAQDSLSNAVLITVGPFLSRAVLASLTRFFQLFKVQGQEKVATKRQKGEHSREEARIKCRENWRPSVFVFLQKDLVMSWASFSHL